MEFKPYDSFLYREVWLVTEWTADGLVLKTKSTRKFIRAIDTSKLNMKKYRFSSISTSITGPASKTNKTIVVDEFDLSNQ